MIDIVPDVISAIRPSALVDELRKVVRDEIRAALEEQREALQSLGAVLGISSKAASMRLARDPGLRKLGIPIGRRIYFKRSDDENQVLIT